MVPFETHGHRGCRGLMPENTIPGFIKALDLNVTTIEMDVVISGDNNVVVSHEAYMSSVICLKPDGSEIKVSEEKLLNCYEMDIATIQMYDCGTRFIAAFPNQQKIKSVKPLLSSVIDAVEIHTLNNILPPIIYNIELKSAIEADGIFNPDPVKFCNLLLEIILAKKIESRVILQSFDVRILNYLHQIKAPVLICLLIDNILGLNHNLDMIDFKPDYYGPDYRVLRLADIKIIHAMEMKVIPWTINDPAIMKNFIDAGVDGIITDYPDKLNELLK